MLTKEQESFVLSKAYVPEHIPKMMSFLSGGDSLLIDNKYLAFKRKNFMILVGYPLDRDEGEKDLEYCIRMILKEHSPSNLFIIGDNCDSDFFRKCEKIEEDFYYIIDIENSSIPERLKKLVERNFKNLTIKLEKKTTDKHLRLIEEFLKRKELPEHIRELYLRFPEYIDISEKTFYLSAYSSSDELAAFYVVENSAKDFSAYMIGCTSKIHPIPHASDCLMFELIRLSKELGKKFINLGLGVNDGIRGFKEKWGGKKFLKYEAYHYRSFGSFFEMFRGMF